MKKGRKTTCFPRFGNNIFGSFTTGGIHHLPSQNSACLPQNLTLYFVSVISQPCQKELHISAGIVTGLARQHNYSVMSFLIPLFKYERQVENSFTKHASIKGAECPPPFQFEIYRNQGCGLNMMSSTLCLHYRVPEVSPP